MARFKEEVYDKAKRVKAHSSHDRLFPKQEKARSQALRKQYFAKSRAGRRQIDKAQAQQGRLM